MGSRDVAAIMPEHVTARCCAMHRSYILVSSQNVGATLIINTRLLAARVGELFFETISLADLD